MKNEDGKAPERTERLVRISEDMTVRLQEAPSPSSSSAEPDPYELTRTLRISQKELDKVTRDVKRKGRTTRVNWTEIRKRDRVTRISTDQAAEFLETRKESRTVELRRKIREILTYRLFEHQASVDSRINTVSSGEKTPVQIDQASELSGNVPKLDSMLSMGERFAEGGQGVLSSATELALNRLVAVKSLRPELTEDVQQRTRFIQEAKVTAQLDHPSIVPIYMIATDDHHGLHLSMKKLQGITL